MKIHISENLKLKLNQFEKSWEKSILFSNFLKLIEMYIEVNQGIKILDNPILNKRKNPRLLKKIQNINGIGIIEAPRGTLIHHYTLNENHKIENIKLFIATEINISIINEMLTKFAKNLYDITGDIEIIKQKAQMIIRAFDPCISCATH
ncbi:MAG: nickel-dependent hydrogenase large subunit [Candidatus Lokiarchaeota archaeon]|nr:nickel-dependent hydrogenase large subunit [Candidatus Lokiarchaeota archaeon]